MAEKHFNVVNLKNWSSFLKNTCVRHVDLGGLAVNIFLLKPEQNWCQKTKKVINIMFCMLLYTKITLTRAE